MGARQAGGSRNSNEAAQNSAARNAPGDGEENSTAAQPPSRTGGQAAAPSEFQKFVERTTGRLLPAFGSRFFAEAREIDRSLANVPVTADYVVGPGDELVLRAWGGIDMDYRATIDRNGQVNLPRVGTFNVAGVRASDLDRHLRSQIGRLFTNFDMSVSLGQLRAVQVFIVGPALRPGVYTLPSQSTLLSAVVAASGPDANGSMRHIELRRNGRVVSELDIYDFLVQGDKSKDLQLVGGDVIVFKPVGPQVALTGTTDSPAIYELRETQQTLGDLLRFAGGTPVLTTPRQAQLERIDTSLPGAARFVEQIRLDNEGLKKPLRNGDILTLFSISPQFANAVTLKGHVAQALRSPFKPGMRIRDLIPDPEALISGDFYQRKNMLVQIIDEPTETAASMRNQARASDVVVGDRRRTPQAVLFNEVNWEFAVIERLNMRDLTTELINFNLRRAVLEGDPAHNLELKAGDVVTIYGQADLQVPVSRQTRIVSVEGEVSTPGVYQLAPGETLRQLLNRVGGFTPQAYVYGLEFTREETRRRQQANLTAVLTRLDAMAATQAARDAANRRDEPTGAATSVAVSAAATQAQRARISRVQPNGRIALELSPDMQSVDQLPDLLLDNADRVVVPTRPGFVTVTGAVVNDNAFLWRPGRTAGDYIKIAGLDDVSNASAMFILRADGTVSHSNDRRGLFGYGSLASSPAYPGDTIVVPNQLDFETWGRALVRNLKDFSQIFYQFGLGAAAIRTLKN